MKKEKAETTFSKVVNVIEEAVESIPHPASLTAAMIQTALESIPHADPEKTKKAMEQIETLSDSLLELLPEWFFSSWVSTALDEIPDKEKFLDELKDCLKGK